MGPIILCHAFEDKKVVSPIHDTLKDSGFEVWIDSESVFGEQDWEPDIADWLGRAACMLIFLSKNSVRKIDSTRHEFGQLIDAWKDIPTGTVYTISVRINDCQIPDLLSSLEHIDLFEDQGLERVIRRLREGSAKPQQLDHGGEAQKSGQAAQDNALDDLQVAVDGRGEVVDVPGIVNDQQVDHDISTDAVTDTSREEDGTA
jgi:hypothetical protein